MHISIFIPTGNRAESLKIVLDSLVAQTYQDFDIIIVDYKSTDNTPQIIESFNQKLKITVLHQTEKGLARAANMALDIATGDIFIRTDDDVKMSTGWLQAIHDTFTDPQVGGVTGPTVIPEDYKQNRDLFVFENAFKTGNAFWKTIGYIYFNYFMEGNPRKVSYWFDSGAFGIGSNFEEATKEPLHEITNLEACNFSVRTELLRKVKGFDTIYSGVGEYHEADAAFKIKELGYKLMFNPKAYLNHRPSQDGFYNDRPESYSRMINFITFYLRHIKANSYRKFFRFSSYILFLDGYYVYQYIKTKQTSQLGALWATLVGPVIYFADSRIRGNDK